MKKRVKKGSHEKIKFLNKTRFNKNNIISCFFFIILLLVLGLIIFSNYQKDEEEFIGKRIGRLYSAGAGATQGCPVDYEVTDDGYCTNSQLAECELSLKCDPYQDGQVIYRCWIYNSDGDVISTCTDNVNSDGVFDENECTNSKALKDACDKETEDKVTGIGSENIESEKEDGNNEEENSEELWPCERDDECPEGEICVDGSCARIA